jgi:periplasmic protein TonB
MSTRLAHDRPDDRLATAIFAAAVIHGVLILGVRFSAPLNDDRTLPTLEVLLVPDGRAEPANPTANYIAARSQQGSGTTLERQRTSLPEASPTLLENAGEAEGDAYEPETASETAGAAPILSARTPEAPRSQAGADTEQPSRFYAMPQESRPLQQVGVTATAADRELRLRGKPSPNDRLLADTRESAIAGYLDGWKRRIERVGTLNFPNEARRRSLSGNPVLEVAITANGRLDSVIVRRSSGHRELDNAAIGIVKLAAPFDPFPMAMRDRYPVLRFAYEWQFINGRLGDGAVFSDAP